MTSGAALVVVADEGGGREAPAPRTWPGWRRDVIAALDEDRRVEVAGRRLERRAARMGRRDAEAGRFPPHAPTLQKFRGAYAKAFLAVLVARWPPRVVAKVRKRKPWVFAAASPAPHGGVAPSCAVESEERIGSLQA